MTSIVPIRTVGFEVPVPEKDNSQNEVDKESQQTHKALDEDDEKEHEAFSKAIEEAEIQQRESSSFNQTQDLGPKEIDATDSNSRPIYNSWRLKKQVPDDYIFGNVLGVGAFSQVKVAIEKDTKARWAIKIIDKMQIARLEQRTINQRKVSNANTQRSAMEAIKMEKEVLEKLTGHPNITGLGSTFQDQDYLYFALEFCPNGDLFDLIKKAGRFDDHVACFYAAEIINGLEFMHSKNIIHRDLKPENILVDPDMHLKLSDFGTAQTLNSSDERVITFAGTAEYISPEQLIEKWSGKMADLWALGCVIYQMLAGKPPFKGKTEFLTFTLIKERELTFPSFFSPKAKDLIDQLLQLDPTKRLGANGYQEIKSHPYFSNINFEMLPQNKPPIIQPHKRTLRVRRETEERRAALASQKMSPWNKFMFDSELIIHSALVWKKKGGIYLPRKRQLILTDLPRLIYVDPEKMQQKGEIPWSNEIRVKCQSEKRFTVKVPGRTFFFDDVAGKSNLWYDHISKFLSEDSKAL